MALVCAARHIKLKTVDVVKMNGCLSSRSYAALVLLFCFIFLAANPANSGNQWLAICGWRLCCRMHSIHSIHEMKKQNKDSNCSIIDGLVWFRNEMNWNWMACLQLPQMELLSSFHFIQQFPFWLVAARNAASRGIKMEMNKINHTVAACWPLRKAMNCQPCGSITHNSAIRQSKPSKSKSQI